MKYKKAFWVEFAIVAAILLLGAYVRFTHLTCLPPGLYPDEAMNTSDGLRAAEAGTWKLFYENNNGREGLYISILGYLLHWFGPSLWIVRFLPALIGTLTLFPVWWMGRRMSGKFGGYIALALIAFSYWHLNFSRVGFRALLMVFMLSWAFAFMIEGFWRAFLTKREKLKWQPCTFFALGGLFLGLSLHTYIAVRIAPAAVIVLFAMALIFFWSYWKDILKYGVITVVFAFITAAPLLYDFYKTPTHFTGRTSNVSVMGSPHLVQDLAKTTFLTFASFIAYGDQNWRHNYPWLPLVLPIWGVVLFVGVGWGIGRFFTEIGKKCAGRGTKDDKKNWEMVAWIFLIAWWGFLLLPSILTNEGLPHALRNIGAIPPTFLLVALILNKWAKNNVKWKTAIAILVASSGIFSMYAYFFLWGRSPSAYDAFDYRTSGIGTYIRDLVQQEPKTHFYVITNQDSFLTDAGLPVMIEPIRFYTWDYRDRVTFMLPEDFSANKIKLPAKIFTVRDNGDVTDKIKGGFPQVVSKQVKMGTGQSNPNADPVQFAPQNEECFLATPINMDTTFPYYQIDDLVK